MTDIDRRSALIIATGAALAATSEAASGVHCGFRMASSL